MPLPWPEIRDKAISFSHERVAFLFELYQRYTSLLPGEAKPKRKAKRKPAH